MISVHEAQQIIDRHAKPVETEAIPLAQLHGRILREPVASPEDLPPFDRSAMDGYAVRADDAAEQFGVAGEIRAGEAKDLVLAQGQCVRIFTGARMPGSGLRVIPQEHVEKRGEGIRVLKRSSVTHVRLQGEDARAGETLLEPGTVLEAATLALLASMGKTVAQVSRPLRILHLTSGDEIVPPEETPAPGQIRNSNAPLIAGLCREQGVPELTHLHAGDDLAALKTIMTSARAETFDLVLISGGSGRGDYDFSAELFRSLGATIHFRELDVRPGKPLIFGTTPTQLIFGLPGNALSHFVCFHLFVRRALERMSGRRVSATTKGVLVEELPDSFNPRETWWPARAELREGRLECRALPWKSSGDITRLPSANALLHVPASTSSIAAATMIDLLLTRPLPPPCLP